MMAKYQVVCKNTCAMWVRTQTADTSEQAARDHVSMCGIDDDGPVEATIEVYPFHDTDLTFIDCATQKAPRLRATVPEPWNNPTYAGRTKKEEMDFLDVIYGSRDGISRSPVAVFTVTKPANGGPVAIKTVMMAKCRGRDAMGGPCPNLPTSGNKLCQNCFNAQEAVS